NSTPQPPVASTTVLTRWPTSCRCTCPGTNWVKLLAIAMIGLPKSASVMPVARQRERAPAMLRPCVEVRLRYPVLMRLKLARRREHGASEACKMREKNGSGDRIGDIFRRYL